MRLYFSSALLLIITHFGFFSNSPPGDFSSPGHKMEDGKPEKGKIFLNSGCGVKIFHPGEFSFLCWH